MSRAFKLSLAALLVAGALPAAASQQMTEVVASFEDVVEAPAFVLSGTADAPAQVTEQVASFDERASSPALVLSGQTAGSQQVTEIVASFEEPVSAPVTGPVRVAKQAADSR